MDALLATRRDLLIAPLLTALPLALAAGRAAAAPDPTMTIVKLPEQLTWVKPPDFPERSVEQAPLWSKTSEPGLYYTLVKWHPGYMSAARPRSSSSTPAPLSPMTSSGPGTG